MKRVFAVLGMHRGGTSAVARSLTTLGIPLGDAMLPAQPDNPTGFWEDREIVALNDRLLAALGLHWHSLAPIPEDALQSCALAGLRAEAAGILSARLSERETWGFKDPRVSRLLGFWLPILRNLDLAVSTIVAVRNPLSVALSLQRRDLIEAEKSHLLWGLHMLPLLRLAGSTGVVVVDYDALLADPEGQLARMAQRLGLGAPDPAAVAAYAGEFLDARLRHSQFTGADVQADPRLAEAVAKVHHLLVRCAGDKAVEPNEVERAERRFGALLPALSYAHALESALAAQQLRITGLESEVAGDIASLKTDLAALQLAAQQQANRHAALEAAIALQQATLKADMADLGQQLANDQPVVAALSEQVTVLSTAVIELRAQAECHDADVSGLIAARQSRRLGVALRMSVRGTRAWRRLQQARKLTADFGMVAREQGLGAAVARAADFVRWRVLRPAVALRPAPVAVTLEDVGPPASITEMRSRGPVISILTPVFNTPPEILEDAIQSVLQQTYANWELCICDDCSSNASTLEVLERYRGTDWRIKIVRAPAPLHIAGATNLAAEQATGEFVGFLDHDDLLEPDALQHVAQTIGNEPDADLIYTDEDKLEMDGQFSEPYLKPDWSPEHLHSVMYILHFMVVRKKLFFGLGGLRNEFTGSQDYDLALRATAKARKVVHIPRILYHWRKLPGSAADVVDAKPEALQNAKRALQDFVGAQDPSARVVDGLLQGTYRVMWSVDVADPVTLAILTGARHRDVDGRGRLLLVENFVDSIVAKSTYPQFKLLVVDDDGNLPPRVRRKVEQAGGAVVSFPLADRAFNFSEKANFAFSQVQTEDVILLNDDLEVITPDWIEALLAFSRRPGVGAVGARLLFPDNRIQHAGVILGAHGSAAHLFHNLPSDEIGYCGFTHLVRNYSAVTGAVLATRMSIVREVGSFDEKLAVDFNDIDFCLRIRAAGYRVVYTPYAQLYHFEGSSLPRRIQNHSEQAEFLRRWQPQIDADPYYHPQLPRDRTDCVVA